MIIKGQYAYIKLIDEYSAEVYDVASNQLICMADKETALAVYNLLNKGA